MRRRPDSPSTWPSLLAIVHTRFMCAPHCRSQACCRFFRRASKPSPKSLSLTCSRSRRRLRSCPTSRQLPRRPCGSGGMLFQPMVVAHANVWQRARQREPLIASKCSFAPIDAGRTTSRPIRPKAPHVVRTPQLRWPANGPHLGRTTALPRRHCVKLLAPPFQLESALAS